MCANWGQWGFDGCNGVMDPDIGSVLHIVFVLALDWRISPGLTFDWQISLGLTQWSRIKKDWRWSGISLEMDQTRIGAGLALRQWIVWIGLAVG